MSKSKRYQDRKKVVPDVSPRVKLSPLTGQPYQRQPKGDYKIVKTELSPGDTLLLMSDGLPELFNGKDEMLDYLRIKEAFREVAEKHPTQIVRHLLLLGDKWRNGKEQNDDITLLVLKVQKTKSRSRSGQS